MSSTHKLSGYAVPRPAVVTDIVIYLAYLTATQAYRRRACIQYCWNLNRQRTRRHEQGLF